MDHAERRNRKHQAVLECTDVLVTAVQNCIDRFASACLAKGLISEEVNEFTLTTGHTDALKARKLVKSVHDAIRNDHSRFDTFVEVMKMFPHLESEVESLQNTLHRISQEQPRFSSSSSETDAASYRQSSSLGNTGHLSSPDNDSPLAIPPSGGRERAMETEAMQDTGSHHHLSSSSTETDGISYRPSTMQAFGGVAHPETNSPVFAPPNSGEGEMAMEIEAEQGPVVEPEEIVGSCTIPRVVNYIRNVKNVRAFGILLNIDSGKLDEIERSSPAVDSRIMQIMKEWFKTLPNISDADRWEELGNVLLQPAVDEPGIAIKLQPHLRRGSSVDSAISVFSNRSGSFSSPTSPSPYYHESYIESIGRKPEECSKANVLNFIVPFSEWYEIGLFLSLPVDKLDEIKECPVADRKSLLVELWYRQGLHGFTWTRLQEALVQLLRWKSGRGSGTSGVTNFTQPHLLTTTPPCLPDPIEPSILYSEQELEEKYKELQFAFQEIQDKITDVLEQKGVLFKHFRRAVRNFLPHMQLNSFRNLKSISGDTEFEDIFSSWSRDVVWSFLDFTLLEGIVRKYGSNGLKNSMREYSIRLQDFRKRTLVSRLMKIWTDPNLPEECEQCKTLILNLKIRADQCTLEMLQVYKNHSCNKLLKGISLSEAALVLFHLKPGCVLVTWIVQSNVVQIMREALIQCVTNGEYFKENSITSAVLDGELFMPMEGSLIMASAKGDIKKIDHLIDNWNHEKHNINETDLSGKTALMLASENGYESIVCALLETGDRIDINYQMEDTQWSALFFAYKNGHDGVVKLLREYGADTSLLSKDNTVAADMGVQEKPGLVKTIGRTIASRAKGTFNLAKKILPLKKKLLSLCEIGDVEGIKGLLMEESVNVNIKDASHKDWTPLMWACDCGHYEVVELLLQHGADIHLTNTDWKTALYLACSKNHIRIAYRLLRSGADPNIISERQYTPLMYICDMEHMEPMARALFKYGAEAEIAADKNGWTPLILASHYGKKELVELFLDHGAEVNRTARRGWTAIMAAARKDRGEIVKLLLDRGASMEMKMKDAKKNKKVTGEPALHIASYMGSTSVIPILVQHGADPNVTNAAGLSALMIATKRQNKEVVKALCQSPTIDLDLPQEGTGLTALFLAAKNGDAEIVRTLLEYGASEIITVRGQTANVRDVAILFKKKAIVAVLEEHKKVPIGRQMARPIERQKARAEWMSASLEGWQVVVEGEEVVVENAGSDMSVLDHNTPAVVLEGEESTTPGSNDDPAVGEIDKHISGVSELEPELLVTGDLSIDQIVPETETREPTEHPITPTATDTAGMTTDRATHTEQTTPTATDTATAAHPAVYPSQVTQELEGDIQTATTHQSGEQTPGEVKTLSLFEEIFQQQKERTQESKQGNKAKTTAKRTQPTQVAGRKGMNNILQAYAAFDDTWRDYEHMRSSAAA